MGLKKHSINWKNNWMHVYWKWRQRKQSVVFHVYGVAGFKNVGNTLEYKNGKRDSLH